MRDKFGRFIKGSNGRVNCKQSNETKEKIRLIHIGRKQSLETKLKKSLALKMAHQTKKWGFNKGDVPKTAFKKGHKFGIGRKQTEISKQKNREAHLGSKSYLWKGGLSKNMERRRLMCLQYASARRILGKIPLDIITEIIEENKKYYGSVKCEFCLIDLDIKYISIDHIVPISKGGTNDRNNLHISCRTCNYSKNKKSAEEYILFHTRKLLRELELEGHIRRMDEEEKKLIFGQIREDAWRVA